MSQPTGSAPAGEMPAAGGMPSAAPAGEYAPAPGGVVSPAVEESGNEPDESDDATQAVAPAGQAPAAPAAPDAGMAPLPPTPKMAEIAQAAQGYLAKAQQVQQNLPAVQAARAALEAQLTPYVQNPDLFAQLPPEAQYAVRQGYGQWQQLARQEQQFQADWAEITNATPQLQTMYALEQRTAMLNKVGEPVAYHLLAQRAAQRSGDPNFPIDEMTEFLQGTPASILEDQATKFETLYKKGRLRERAAGMVDAMGPGSGNTAGGQGGYRPGRQLIDEAIQSELRQRPPR